MGENIVIKGRTLRKGQPIPCVPIMGNSASAVLSQAKEAVELGLPMIEWRADHDDELADENALRGVLRELAGLCKDTILLVTVRSKEQGGEADLSPEQLERIYDIFASEGCMDMADVEYFQWKDAAGIVRRLQQAGIVVVASQHYFEETPSKERMWECMDRMRRGGADVVKLAVMPQDLEDTLRLMGVTYRFSGEYPGTPVISMAMGKDGMLSRIAGECFGSCVTFGCLGEASAPGQLPINALRQMLDAIHETIGGGAS